MNIFAGNFSVKNKTITPELDFDIIQISETAYFIMGWDEDIDSVSKLKTFLEAYFGEIVEANISIDSEWSLEILMAETEWEVYECTSFSWPEVNFDAIIERFAGSDEAISIREWKKTPYGNREVLVDFLY